MSRAVEIITSDTDNDDGERRCAGCGNSFNLEEGGHDFVPEAGGSICLMCEDDWPEAFDD